MSRVYDFELYCSILQTLTPGARTKSTVALEIQLKTLRALPEKSMQILTHLSGQRKGLEPQEIDRFEDVLREMLKYEPENPSRRCRSIELGLLPP